MMARIIGLATAAALAAPAALGQASSASAASAQFFVTGYVLQGVTATGTYVHPGTCAVDPRVIPLGSYMTINGLGTCHAEDTGGAIIGYRIDVWVPTVAQAYALTGWYTASWGASPTQQVLGYQASQPQSPAPTPRRVPHRQARTGRAGNQRWYRHGNAYVHHGNAYVHGATRAQAHDIVTQPAYALISRHGKGCRGVRWTTIVAGVRACMMATLPPLHDMQKGGGLHEHAGYSAPPEGRRPHKAGAGPLPAVVRYPRRPCRLSRPNQPAPGQGARPHTGVTRLRANRNHPRRALCPGGGATSSIAGRIGRWWDAGDPSGERDDLSRRCAARAGGDPSGERLCRSAFLPTAKAGGLRRIVPMIHRNFSSSAMMRLMVGSTVKIVRPAAATEMAVPLVWLLAITVLAFVSSTATLVVVTRRYMGCPDADDHGGPVIDRAV